MFKSLHIHITTLSCFDGPVSLFGLIFLHQTQSEIDQLYPMPFSFFLPNHCFSDTHSLPIPCSLPPPPPSVSPWSKLQSRGNSPSCNNTPLPLVLSSTHPQTLSLTDTYTQTHMPWLYTFAAYSDSQINTMLMTPSLLSEALVLAAAWKGWHTF